MMNLDPNLLKTLISVAESKSFQEAARRLGISQPAVSFQLRQLEACVPMPLFYLSGKRKVLTHYGQSLFETAKRQMDALGKSLEDLDRYYADPAKMTLRIGGRLEVLGYVSDRITFPGRLEFIQTSSGDAVRKLLAHELDIAISYQLPDSADLMAKKLFQSSSYIVAHKNLLHRKKLNLDLAKNPAFLKESPAIVYQRSGHILQDWIRHCGLSLTDLNIRYIVEDWRLVKDLVDRGSGYALVPEYVSGFGSDIVRLELPAGALPRYTFHALFERGLKKIKAFQEVLEFRGFV